MQRVVIAVLLLTIGYSTMLSNLSHLMSLDVDRALLDSVVGAVTAGNFSYWALGYAGPLIVEINSLSGDADIFIGNHNRPSYELDKHNFSSETCGTDVIYVPKEFPRPLGIGVFGYWSHAVSEFSIHVYLDGTKEDLEALAIDHRTKMKEGKNNIESSLTSTSEPYKGPLPVRPGEKKKAWYTKFFKWSEIEKLAKIYFRHNLTQAALLNMR